MITTDKVKLGPYTYDLGTDWVAVDDEGNPLARARTQTAVEAAAPGAAGYFTAVDFQWIADEDNLPSVDVYLAVPETHFSYAVMDENRKVLASGYARHGHRDYPKAELNCGTRFAPGMADIIPVGEVL